MKKVYKIPKDRECVSSLEGVYISQNRRMGNTTRIIDNIIQIIMSGKVCKIEDHYNGRLARIHLLNRLCERIAMEHHFVWEDVLRIDYNKEFIWIEIT